MCCVCAPVGILHWSCGKQWVDLHVNQWSGIGHFHHRVSMHVGSACAWKTCMGRNECIRIINRHWWQQQFWKYQSVIYNRDWCALTWNLTFTYISGVMCCLPAMVMWGTNLLIRKHSLQHVVWKYYSTCPNLLIDLSHLIPKICCMCICGGVISSRFGHTGYWLVLVGQHQSGIAPQSLLVDLILDMPMCIGWWAPHCMLVVYFST